MIVLDMEASGLDPNKHSLVSLGALDFNNPQNRFYEECRIDEDATYTDEALAVNGFSIEDIQDPQKQTVREMLQKYFDWAREIPDQTIAGQNVYFDRYYINESCRKHSLPNLIDKRIVDMHSVCLAKLLTLGKQVPLTDKFSALNTDSILKFVGLAERKGAHHALDDALLEAEAFSRLIFGTGLLEEYRAMSVPAYLS
jgi:DNA polymerase III epsilon subunit-like protein